MDLLIRVLLFKMLITSLILGCSTDLSDSEIAAIDTKTKLRDDDTIELSFKLSCAQTTHFYVQRKIWGLNSAKEKDEGVATIEYKYAMPNRYEYNFSSKISGASLLAEIRKYEKEHVGHSVYAVSYDVMHDAWNDSFVHQFAIFLPLKFANSFTYSEEEMLAAKKAIEDNEHFDTCIISNLKFEITKSEESRMQANATLYDVDVLKTQIVELQDLIKNLRSHDAEKAAIGVPRTNSDPDSNETLTKKANEAFTDLRVLEKTIDNLRTRIHKLEQQLQKQP